MVGGPYPHKSGAEHCAELHFNQTVFKQLVSTKVTKSNRSASF